MTTTTKARTEGQRRRARRGRPRKEGPREPNGQPSRAYAAMTEMRPALLARCAVMRWEPTDENLRRARDPRLALLAGRLLAVDRFCADAFLGLVAFATLRTRYLAEIGAPPPHPPAPAIETEPAVAAVLAEGGRGEDSGMEETPEDRYRRLRMSYEGAEARLLRQPVDVRHATRWTIDAPETFSPHDMAAGDVARAVIGGREVARFFGLRA